MALSFEGEIAQHRERCCLPFSCSSKRRGLARRFLFPPLGNFHEAQFLRTQDSESRHGSRPYAPGVLVHGVFSAFLFSAPKSRWTIIVKEKKSSACDMRGSCFARLPRGHCRIIAGCGLACWVRMTEGVPPASRSRTSRLWGLPILRSTVTAPELTEQLSPTLVLSRRQDAGLDPLLRYSQGDHHQGKRSRFRKTERGRFAQS